MWREWRSRRGWSRWARSPRCVGGRFFSALPLANLGVFSYSLYLLHLPLLIIAYHYLWLPRHFGWTSSFLLQLCITVPLILCVSFLFYRIIERPFTKFPAWLKRGDSGAARK